MVQAFLAVAETGSLSGAARHLGQSQPTIGRHVQATEVALGVRLFDRQPRGMALTEVGAALVEPAQAMRDAAGRLALIAAGEAEQTGGTIRLAASEFFSHHVLPPVLASLRQQAPGIAIELVASDASENLLFREADIAIRMYRPEQLDILTRHLGDMPLGLFGATSYLDTAGRPENAEDLQRHSLVGYDNNDAIIRGMRALGWPADRDWFDIRCDHQTTYWELVRAGCGVGFCQLPTGRGDPTVEQVLPDLPLPPLPVWLACHAKLRRSPRVRLVWDHLARHLRGLFS